MPNLTTVTLPANLTNIPKDAFANSAKLATVNFGDASTNNGGGSGPSGRAVTGDANAITLPSKIATIGNNAFAGTAATTVDLSKITAASFTTINDYVFKDMTSLAEVKLPATITTINQSAFQGDAKLVKLTQVEAATNGGGAQTRDEDPTTAKFGKSLTSIQQNAFYGTGFTTVDLSKAGTAAASTGRVAAAASTPNPLTVSSNAFTNMANLTTVKLPANANNINPANFGNPTDAETQKLTSITYGENNDATATSTLSDATISSLNFSKITNKTIEIKSSTSSAINFNGGVFNGNSNMTKLMLNVTQNPANGNASL